MRMAFRLPSRSLRETPRSCHLSARSTTADITSRRSSSSVGRMIWKSRAIGNLIDWVSLTDHTAHTTAITGVPSFIFIRKLSLVHSMHRVWMAGLPSYSCEMLNCSSISSPYRAQWCHPRSPSPDLQDSKSRPLNIGWDITMVAVPEF